MLIATKFGLAPSSDKSRSVRGDRECIRQSCTNSLQRLGIDSIDLYYAHPVDKTTAIEETMAALKELIIEGKIKYIGLCECSSNTVRRAHAVHPLSAVQIEYSPFSLDIEHEDIGLLKTCPELGIAIFCYLPLGHGMVTGQKESPDDFEDGDFRKRYLRFSEENLPQNLQLVNTLSALAKKKGCVLLVKLH